MAWINSPIDYVHFFCGMSLLVLSIFCFKAEAFQSKSFNKLPLITLGIFALLYGLHEWLELAIASTSNSAFLDGIICLLLALSFLALLEFGRKLTPGISSLKKSLWLFAPLLFLTVTGTAYGSKGLHASIGYFLALPAGFIALRAIMRVSAKEQSRDKILLLLIGTLIALFTLASVLAVPESDFLLAKVINSESFQGATGFPIQLLSGFIALLMAMSLFEFSENSQISVNRTRYGRAYVLIFILFMGVGLAFTSYLGGVAQRELERETDTRASILIAVLNDNLSDVDAAAIAFSGSDAVVAALTTGNPTDIDHANKMLARVNTSLNMSICYLLDRTGLTVASSNRNDKNNLVGKSFAFRSYFKGAIAGRKASYFAKGSVTSERGYYFAAPVVGEAGTIIGVVVTKRIVEPLETEFRKYPNVFLVSPDGIIFITSKPELLFRSLWPVAERKRSNISASRQFGDVSFASLLPKEPPERSYIKLNNDDQFSIRIPYGKDGWSLVVMEQTGVVSNYRLFGILVTFAMGIMLSGSFIILIAYDKSKEAARKLYSAKEGWERTFDAVPDFIAVIDRDMRIAQLNKALADRLGISKEEAVGRRCHEMLHCTKESRSCPYQKMLDSGIAYSTSLFNERLNAELVVTSSPLFAADGTLEASILMMHDITVQKLAEDAAKKSADYLNQIINRIGDPIFVKDQQHRFLLANAAMCNFLGKTQEELIGTTCVEFLPEEEMAVFFKKDDIVFETGEENLNEEDLTDKEGEVHTILTKKTLHIDDDGNKQLICVIRDITERKLMEEELREYAEKLSLVTEGSNDATWEWDMVSNKAQLNARYYEMTEFAPREVDMSYERFISWIHPDDVPGVESRVREHLDGKTDKYVAQYRLVTRSGKIRHVMGRGRIVKRDADGSPLTMAGVITDITEQKKLSDDINMIRNLESVGILAGGLAHDFNNILNIIYCNVSYAKMLSDGEPSISEALTDAEVACERAKELGIRLQVLAQGGDPVMVPIVIEEIIEVASSSLFKDSSISCTVSSSDDLCQLEADPRQIRQVFESLLTNAKEAMHAGGWITVNIKNAVIDANSGLHLGSGSYARIEIRDNGKGIPEESLTRIFEPYFSSKDTFSQKGLGLGLPICHAIMKKHNGHITIDSEMGHGTTVNVYLPAAARIELV